MNEEMRAFGERTVLEAYAKINLTLDVTGKREDGYHTVQMVMQTVSLHDTVTLERTAQEGIRMTASFPAADRTEDPGKADGNGLPGMGDIPTDGRNLMVRTAERLFCMYDLPGGLTMHLEKRIPSAAGLAGGSSDAAAVLRGMNGLYGLSLDDEALGRIGVQIGADVPYCIRGGTLLAEGIGEILSPLPPCEGLHLLLVKPPVSVSTPAVYKAYDRMSGPAGDAAPDDGVDLRSLPDASCTHLRSHADVMKDALASGAPETIAAALYNDLQPVTEDLQPEVGKIAASIRENGALNALMSGSGPTVFGIFRTHSAADAAGKRISERFPDCFVCTAETVDPNRK